MKISYFLSFYQVYLLFSLEDIIFRLCFKLNSIFILYFINRMGNQFQVPSEIRQQWQQITVKDQKVLRNKFTFQVFKFLVLQKVHQEQNISKLIQRSIYSMPGTPKIIILNDQQGQICILVQENSYSLSEYLSKLILPIEYLELLQKITRTLSSLLKKYGPFHLAESMLGMNQNMEVIAWINCKKYKNQPELPLERKRYAEKVMIEEFLSIIKNIANFSIQKEVPQLFRNSFEELGSFLASEIRKRKVIQANKAQEMNKYENIIKRTASPMTSFGSSKIRSAKNINLKIVSPNAKKNIPQFIQKNKPKVKHLLDSLHHRRTLTIQEAEAIVNEKKNEKMIKQTVKKKQYSHSPSIGRIKSMKEIPRKQKNYNLSYGEISQTSFPSQQEIPTHSKHSTKNIVKKRQSSDLKTFKSSKDIVSTVKMNYGTINYPKTPNPNTSYPVTFDVQQNFLDENTQSCVFDGVQKEDTTITPSEGKKYNQFCINTNQSKYLGSITKSKIIVEEDSHQTISKTLQDQINDFFSNPSKSPRFMLGPMQQSLDIQREFEKIIDL